MFQRAESIVSSYVTVGTKQVTDEDGLRYLVTSIAIDKVQGLIAAYREMVMYDGIVCKRKLGPF